MDSFADRLKSLGFKPASKIEPPMNAETESLESHIKGILIENSAGSFVMKEEIYSNQYQHGEITFSGAIDTEAIHQAGKLREPSPNSFENMIFIDTETTGLSGGAGTFAFLVGVGSFNPLEGFKLQQFILRDPTEEKAMLLHLTNLVRDDSIFVSFNGKSFDIPLLQNRLIVNRIPGNFRERDHLDILHLSRKIWGRQLPSCTLKDLETNILHLARTSEDVPGWMIPDIYFRYLHDHDPAPIADVIYHNAQDIVSLAALFIHITHLLEADLNQMEISTDDLIAISSIYWNLRTFETACQILQSCEKRDLNRSQLATVHAMLGKYFKQQRLFSEAADHWQIAAANGDFSSYIDLAKYFEHEVRDIKSAIHWTNLGQSLISNNQSLKNARLEKELQKRVNRLQAKEGNHVSKEN